MLLWFPSWHFSVTRQQNPCPRKERTARHLSLLHLVSMAHDSFQKAYCSLSRIGVPTNTLGCYFQISLRLSVRASVDKMIPWGVSPSLWFCSKSTVASGTHTSLSTAWYVERLPREKASSVTPSLPCQSQGKGTNLVGHLLCVRLCASTSHALSYSILIMTLRYYSHFTAYETEVGTGY